LVFYTVTFRCHGVQNGVQICSEQCLRRPGSEADQVWRSPCAARSTPARRLGPRTTSSILRRASVDPELLEERRPERVVLVVAHAL
jgi:hypothetical protein